MIEKLQEFLKSVNLETVKELLQKEWMPVVLSLVGGLILLIIVSSIKRRIRRRRILRATEKDLGYDPRSIPSGAVGLACQFFLCGAAMAASFFDLD